MHRYATANCDLKPGDLVTADMLAASDERYDLSAVMRSLEALRVLIERSDKMDDRRFDRIMTYIEKTSIIQFHTHVHDYKR